MIRSIPTNWTVQTEIRSNNTTVASVSNGQPSGSPFRQPFIFIRDGSNVSLSMGNGQRLYTATETYNPNNNKVSLYGRPELDGGTANNNETGFYNLRILYNARSRFTNSAPEVSASYGHETGTVMVTSSNVTVKFAGAGAGLSYGVQRATNVIFTLGLSNWPAMIAPPDGLFNITDNFSDLGGQPTAAYYRLRYAP